ncbi:MAG: C4-type zinc ribbon domain-containing protein, partial [Candidatus Marinimicrobia bacterium]|nr:C4-type zinc ribbon domain-containing protein [Candidatus Neomarinimicrobiota bacterium]
KICKDINPNYLRKYDITREAWDGKGLISINRNACGSCFSTLPPQTVIEVRANDNLHSCPSCGILLFWDGAED